MYQFPPPSADTAEPLVLRQPARLIPTRGQAMVCALVAAPVVLALLLVASGLKIDLFAYDTVPYYVGCVLALALRFGLIGSSRPALRRLAHGAEYYGIFALIGLLGAIASYPIAANSRGFYDPALQRIDAALRFDWLAWYSLVAAHPALQAAGRLAYQTIFYTPALILGYFAWTGRRREAHAFLGSFWIAATLTLALFLVMPAVGPFAYLWRGRIPYMPTSGLWQPQLIPALRHHALHVIDVGTLRGLVSAPSFHTAAGVLYIAGAWQWRAIRWPVVAVSGAMLLSTPVEGTHYLADMLAGAAVALTSLGLIAWLERLPGRRPATGADLAAALGRA